MTILDVIRKYDIPYVQIGNNLYRMRCPFHNDNSKPNLTIYTSTNSFYCFACGAGGGIIEFVSLYEKISKKDAFTKIFGSIELSQIEDNLKNQVVEDYTEIVFQTASKKVKNVSDIEVIKSFFEFSDKLRELDIINDFEEAKRLVKEWNIKVSKLLKNKTGGKL